MKISTLFCSILVTSILLGSNAHAAKENYDRSKPHVAAKEKACDIKTPACKKAMKEKMMKKKQEQVKPQTRATDYNSSRSNIADTAKEQSGNKLIKAKSRATDYNSSRSNRTTSGSAVIEEKKKDKKEDDN